ncbi:hypothetical protein WUBG_17112, partial [Wuchereria bancrofti]
TILFIDETDAQHLVVDSFNRNTLGRNSLNNNANMGAGPAALPGAPANQANQPNQAQPNFFGTWQSALGTGLGFLAGNLFGRGSFPSYPYGYYGYPYYPYNYNYYYRYPYYYYYYG